MTARSGLLTIPAAARRLRVAEVTIRRAIRHGRLPASVVGGKYVVTSEALESFAATRTESRPAPALESVVEATAAWASATSGGR